MTTMTTEHSQKTVRFPAEWESDGAVLLAWPHENTDWNYILTEAVDCYDRLAHCLAHYRTLIIVSPDCTDARQRLADVPGDRVIFVETPTNDTWTRDYGPLTIIDSDGGYKALDFYFNGWGLKFASCYDNLVNETLSTKRIINADMINCRDFVLEGGGIETDGKGALMTTARCQLSPNRNATLTAGEIEEKLKRYFGAGRVHWINHGYLAGDDTDSHIDTLARFAPHDSIVFTGCQDPDDEHYDELEAMKQELTQLRTAEGNPYNLFELPLPDAIFDQEGQRLPATYANFLAMPEVVIMPTYGQPDKDELARRIISVAYERPVETVDCWALIQQHGSLHCATMQLPKQILELCNEK